jgi:uncharacterized lipoprotein NlpE involved in copper resistance
MKKTIFFAIIMAFVLISCNQKNNKNETHHPYMMNKDCTMIHQDSTMMHYDSSVRNRNPRMMRNHINVYSCPMHPKMNGKLNEKCPQCGMQLTEPIPEKKK